MITMRLSKFFAAAMLCILPAGLSAQDKQTIKIGVLKVERERPLPISRLDLPPDDLGFAGGRLADQDNQTTGRFLGQEYVLQEVTTTPEEATSALDALREDGIGFVVTMADAGDLAALAGHAEGKQILLFNAQAPDDAFRVDQCLVNVIHVAPSRAMLADGLAQYLVWKKWREWFLIHGSHPADKLWADALRRAARKFGAKIVEEREYEDTGGARRSDSGHVLVQKQMPVFTQRAEEHDVIVVADESAVFGAYIPYRTTDPSPIAGSAGLRPTSFHASHEAWGATQFQRRFEKEAGRRVLPLDYQVWLAIRMIGESATRTKSNEVGPVRDYIVSDKFGLAAFKGVKVTVRPWNRQLRQPVLLEDGRLVVSVSPQEGFLHRITQLDTLGFDEPESKCDLN